MSIENERTIELIKPGIASPECQDGKWCDWLEQFDSATADTFIAKRICRRCGRAEKVITAQDKESYETVFEKFYGKEE